MLLKTLAISCLFCLTVADQPWNILRRQLPDGVTVQRRVDGHTVIGTVNDVIGDRASNVIASSSDLENTIGSLAAVNEVELTEVVTATEEPGFVDSILGNGAQSRIVDGFNGWIVSKARANPGCVERVVCETYRSGESLNGVPYVAMSLANAAISFMVADMFDQSIDIKELTKAARHGRTIGSCHAMKCDFFDGQLRTLENYFEVVENFVTTIYNSVSGSLSLGK